jgi:hypothetical protein
MKKVTESIRIEDRVKTDLVKIGGEFQTKLGKPFTFSDTIDKLIKFYREEKEEA